MDAEVRARRGTFAGDVIKLVSGTTLAQALGILATPILTRLYAPEAFGLLALFASIASLLGIVACLRYEYAIPLPERESDAAALVVACLGFTALITGITFTVVALAGEWMVAMLQAPELGDLLWLIPVFVALSGIAMAFNFWHSRARRFGGISLANVLGAASTTGGKLGAGWAGYAHSGSLIVMTVVGQAITTTWLTVSALRHAGRLFLANAAFRPVWAQLVRYRKFPVYDVWGALLNNASWQVPALLFAACFSQAVVGFYALAFRFICLPMSLIGLSMSQVFYQRLSASRARGEPLSPLVLGVFSRMAALGLFPALIFAIAGPELFAVTFGAHWSEAGVYAQILSLWIGCWFVASPLGLALTALERQGLLLVFNATIFLTRLLAILIGSLRQDVHLALWLFSLTGFLVYGAMVAKVLALTRVSLRQGARALLPPLAAALPLGLALALVKHAWPEPAMVTVAAAVSGIAYLVIVMRRDKELLHLLIDKLTRTQGTA